MNVAEELLTSKALKAIQIEQIYSLLCVQLLMKSNYRGVKSLGLLLMGHPPWLICNKVSEEGGNAISY